MFVRSEAGYSDNVVTHGILSGLWSGFYSLGEVIGPGLGGALLERYGFAVAATVISGINVGTAIIAAVFYSTRTRKNLSCSNRCDINTNNDSYVAKRNVT